MRYLPNPVRTAVAPVSWPCCWPGAASLAVGALFYRQVEAPAASRRIVDALRWLALFPVLLVRVAFGVLRRLLPNRG